MTSGEEHRDELTDDELDDLLSSAADEVMNHAANTEATTAALLRLMDDDTPGHLASRGIAVIMQRSTARRLDLVLDHARAFALYRILYHAGTIVSGIERDLGFIVPSPAFDLARALGRASAVADALDRDRERPDLRRARNLARSFALALDDTHARDRHVVGARAGDLIRALGTARDAGFALAVAHGQGRGSPSSLAVEEAFRYARDLTWDRGFDDASSRGIGDDLARALDHTRELVRSGARTFPPEPDLEPDLDLARSLQLEQDLIRAHGHVQHLITALQATTVDVSGDDLQDLDLDPDELDILAGVIWSDLAGVIWSEQTTWPPAVADEVRARSRPIREGTWQVTDGTELDPADRTTVPAD